MMQALMRRGTQLAALEQARAMKRAADLLREKFGNGTFESGGGQVSVSGRALKRRWLTTPALRFLGISA